MTGLQMRLVFFPASSKLAEVPVSEVVRAFASRRIGSTLSILDRGRELGRLTVKPKRLAESSGIEGGVEIMMAGGLDAVGIGDAAIKVRLISRIWLDGGGALRFVHLGFRMPDGDVEADIDLWPDEGRVSYRVREGERTVFDSESATGDADSLNAKARLLLAAWGIDPTRIAGDGSNREVGEAFSGASAWSSRVEIGGQSVAAYLLEVPVPMVEGSALRFVITRHGELERIEGVLGYEISSAAEDVIERMDGGGGR